MIRPITERMADALQQLNARWKGQRRPKAFYLVSDDWAEFSQSEWPTITSKFGNNPPMTVTEPAFSGVPVRKSKGRSSKLYNHTSSGTELPR